MKNKYLLPLYHEIYGENFQNNFNNRLKMEKAIYLLQEMGISVGNYNFRWYKHGPYSQSLLDDMYESYSLDSDIKFNDNNRILDKIKIIKEIMSNNSGYPEKHSWAECLASILFLKTKMLPTGTKEDEILRKLEELKPHLSDKVRNKKAHEEVCRAFGIA